MKKFSSRFRGSIVLWMLLSAPACSFDSVKNNADNDSETGGDSATVSATPKDSASLNDMPSDSDTSIDTGFEDTGSEDSTSTETESSVDTSLGETDSDSSPSVDAGQRDTDSSDTEISTDTDRAGTDSQDTDSPDSGGPSDSDPPSSGCSSDMHSRTDSHGNIIETCPSDQGCLDGECVPACTAVAAAQGNVGCDFVIPRPGFYSGYVAPCFAVFIANNWNKSAAVTVSWNDTTYDVGSIGRVPVTNQLETSWPTLPAEGVPVEQVAVLFLEGGPTQNLGCPVVPAIDLTTRISKTGRGHAWHITTDTPVSVYDIMPYGGAPSYLPSAGLVLPTTSWSTDYLAVVPPYLPTTLTTNSASQWGQIVASEDDTVVSISPKTDLPSGNNVIEAPAGVTTSYSLNAGEVLLWGWGQDATGPMEMTGSAISANRPISFHGGNEYLCIQSSTSTGGGCDSAHQQIPPVNAWGDKYVVAPFATRRLDGEEESILYRIVGAENDTTLSFDPPNQDAPTLLQQGQWQDFEAFGAFEVSSQDSDHPFYIAQMMPGSILTVAFDDTIGDEEYVNLVPSAQFMPSYVFFTDLTYETTTLTLTQCDDQADFKDVHVECLDSPVSGWMPIGSNSDCRWTTVDIVRDSIGNGDCRNGPQRAYSDRPFGLMVWGIDHAASYAYPAGALVSKINEIVVPVI